MPTKKPTISFILEKETLEKLRKIASENDRSVSKEVERAVKRYIAEEEKKAV